MTKRIVRLIKVKNKYSFCESVREYQNPPKENVHQKKDSKQIDRSENNIKKQLTESRHNKHKSYLQSKIL